MTNAKKSKLQIKLEAAWDAMTSARADLFSGFDYTFKGTTYTASPNGALARSVMSKVQPLLDAKDNAGKNTFLNGVRIIGDQWLTNQQHPVIADGKKERLVGLRFTVKYNAKDGLTMSLVPRDKPKPSQDPKAKPTAKKGRKAAVRKGSDSANKSRSPEAAARDFFENFLEDTTADTLEACIHQMLMYAKSKGVDLSQRKIAKVAK